MAASSASSFSLDGPALSWVRGVLSLGDYGL